MVRIPTTVITGFLGAGKTTLISKLFNNEFGKQIALIVNEFGNVGVDGTLLSECGDIACKKENVVELANGCICCTVADDFIPTMEMLLSRNPAPDHIIIETSGLALPQPLLQAFKWPEVKSRVTVDGVVTVVDTPAVSEGRFAVDIAAVEAQRVADGNLDHESPLHKLFEDQLICADLIVLNKVDLIERDDLESVSQLIDRLKRPEAQVVRAIQGNLPAALVIGQAVGSENNLSVRNVHHDHHHHDHDDFESFTIDIPPANQARDIEQAMVNTIKRHGILRAKGFAVVDHKPMRLVVQAVGSRVQSYFDRRWQEGELQQGCIVVIGFKGLDRKAIIEDLCGVLV